MICLERLVHSLLSSQALQVGPAVQLHVGLEFFILLDSKCLCLYSSLCMLIQTIRTWPLDTVTEVVRKVVHNVQQEREVSYVVHMNAVWL